MRLRPILAALAALSLSVTTAPPAGAAANGKTVYDAQVLRTSYGIPHIQATDWGSLGYGYGYAFAQDNLCILARDVLVSTGTQSRYFGPGTGNANLISDWAYALINSDSRVDPTWASLDDDTRALLQGYADGYNRYRRDAGAGAGAAECRGAEWVRDLTGKDIYRVLRKLMVRAGSGNFTSAMVGAAPPQAVTRAEDVPSLLNTADAVTRAAVESLRGRAHASATLAAAELPDFSYERFGSNGVALGRDLTGGAGALLGNPHFPWFGIERFYPVHLTIPGRYEAMGVSIYGFPLINIGFNRNVAWTHTVSTGRRFILRELRLAPGNPTAYVYDGNVEPMTTEVVTVDVLVAPGVRVPVPHAFYLTRFGPTLIVPPLANWTNQFAYALTDVNIDNTRAFALYREMAGAKSVHDLRRTLQRYVALPWVNTIAADSSGNAFYGDITVVPNVTAQKLGACANTVVAQTLSFGARLYTLDGSTSACDPGSDPDAPVPGIFGAGNLPSLVRGDYAQNSNDSYWLANPSSPLTGFSPLIGTDEGRAQGFRTRLGLTQISDRMAGADGLPGTGFGRQWLQDVLYANRHYSGEIMRADVVALCKANPVVGGIDVSQACSVIESWDGRNKTSSVGAHVWTELWRRVTSPSPAGLYFVPFNPADPVNTPRGLGTSQAVHDRVLADLAATVQYFAANGIPLDAAWGTIHFDERNGERIPIHGGSGVSGVYNAMAPLPPPGRASWEVTPNKGYAPIAAGSSYIQAVTFRPNGPDVRAIVTYSVSTDPESPHYADMTELFSNYGWVDLPFNEGDIRRDPNLEVLKLHEKR
jgi:acyl-homoserine-lactone acylase